MRQHRGDAAAVLALEPVVELEPLLDDVEPAGLGLERVGVAAQLGAQVLGLEPQRGEPFGQRVELGVGAGDGLGEVLGLRAAGDPRVVAAGRDRLRPRPSRREQAVELAQARALGLSEAFSSSLGSSSSISPISNASRSRSRSRVPARSRSSASAPLQLAHPRVGAASEARSSSWSRPQKPSSRSSCAEASVSRLCSCWPKKATIRPPSA